MAASAVGVGAEAISFISQVITLEPGRATMLAGECGQFPWERVRSLASRGQPQMRSRPELA
jgi:hypothetical protein